MLATAAAERDGSVRSRTVTVAYRVCAAETAGVRADARARTRIDAAFTMHLWLER
jgi:hypothetical protein